MALAVSSRGVSGTDLNTVFPNLNRFANPDLGFMM
jgi:hypothetical protein